MARSNSKPGLVGAFVPKCQSDGSYERKQCHGSTGYCWCVNAQTGQELQGTRKGPGQGLVNCNDRPCDLAAANSKPGMLGAFVPKCQSDGSYEQKQCHASTGYCWCVNAQTGQELQGTRKGPGQGDVNCRPCDLARANSKPGMAGAFVPKCQSDGSFEQKQCHGSTGYCWCVNAQTGQELQGTRKGPGQGDVNCKYFLSCVIVWWKELVYLVNLFVVIEII